MKVFSYDEKLYNKKAEGFLYGTTKSAVSFFRSPNANKLKGIGLHVHPECDDIDVIVKGEMMFFNDWENGTIYTAPILILNEAGVPHGVIAHTNKETLMFGIRSPFKGGEILSKKDILPKKKSQIFELGSLTKGSHKLFETNHTIVYVHIDNSFIPKRKRWKERIIMNFDRQNTIINGILLSSKSILNEKTFEELTIETKNSYLIEFIPKGVQHV